MNQPINNNIGTTELSSAQGGRAADALFRIFEDKIRNGLIADGQPLPPEREIVEQYGVSRTVVREAVLALANKGLVEAKPRFRPTVKAPSYDAAIETVSSVVERLLSKSEGIKNLFDLRMMIEAALVRQVAVEATAADIRALKIVLDANEAAINTKHLFYETDMNFHAALYHMPKNPVLPAIHKAYTGWLTPQWSKMPDDLSRNQSNFEAHKAIYEAILTRDPDASEQALRQHLEVAWTQVYATFGDK